MAKRPLSRQLVAACGTLRRGGLAVPSVSDVRALPFGVTSVTTDARGRVQHTVNDSYGDSMLSFADREIELEMTLYLGQPPREGGSCAAIAR